ncbi:MAG: helix-turn-helix transcriptional regulator [Clostridia bacterium]|nr:helix-turn-helix transcriptional regulator [Clostridia bacterium]
MKLKIKEYREEIQLTQSQLADQIGNVQRNVSNWENGVSEPDCETIVKLAKLFDITIDELFGQDSLMISRQSIVGVEHSILKAVQQLTEMQKVTLLQFLREVNNV